MATRGKVDAMISAAMSGHASDWHVSLGDAQSLCEAVRPIFSGEPCLLDVTGPVNVVGDIHGQLTDLLRLLKIGGLPPQTKWLFLGDYVDRGTQSVETICLLFALKIRYPSNVFLIRGNHETREMTEIFGFAHECLSKLNGPTWLKFCDVFNYLPLAAVVAGQYFCVHGGIGPTLSDLQQIRNIVRPVTGSEAGHIMDMLWSDPCPQIAEYGESSRGATYLWGIGPAQRFMRKNKLKWIVRGHQVALNGYDFPFGPRCQVVTIFTASNYSPDIPNKAAFMKIAADGTNELKVLPVRSSSTVMIGSPERSDPGRLRMRGNRPPPLKVGGPDTRPTTQRRPRAMSSASLDKKFLDEKPPPDTPTPPSVRRPGTRTVTRTRRSSMHS